MMDQLISQFPAQLKEAINIGAAASIAQHEYALHKVYVAGLGGSGIGANFVAEFIKDECQLPYLIGKGYDIPKYVDQNTLAIVSSYSGNTEETFSAFQLIKATGAKVVVISSGGKLIESAQSFGFDYIKLPAGSPSPRACLGYSMVQQLFILHKLGLISDRTINQVKTASDLINFDNDTIKSTARELAYELKGKIPILYTTDRMEAVVIRARQQINENAKMLCWHHVVPEMNHNELVGWRDKNASLAVVYFRNNDDLERNQVRIEINKEIIAKFCSSIYEVHSKGNNLVEQSIYFIHLGDWLSWYLSEINGVDAIEIDVIDYLKSKLASL